MSTEQSSKAGKARSTQDKDNLQPLAPKAKKQKPNPGAGLASDSSPQPGHAPLSIDNLRSMVDLAGTSMSRKNVHNDIVHHITLLQSDTSKGEELDELFKLHTKLFNKCKKSTESHLEKISSTQDTKTRTNTKRKINRGLDGGLKSIFIWQATKAKQPELRNEAYIFLTRTLAACGRSLESIHSSPKPESGAVQRRGPETRLNNHKKIVDSISAMEKSKSNQPEVKLELEILYRTHDQLFEDYKQRVEKQTDINNKDKNRRVLLRDLLKDGMTEVLKWRQEHARDKSQREAAGELLERAQRAGARMNSHTKITNETTLEQQVRSLESRKAEEMLLCVDRLRGNSQSRSRSPLYPSGSKKTGWKRWSDTKKQQIKKYLDKEDNGIDKKNEELYRQRVNDCIIFSRQEVRIRQNSDILRYKALSQPPELVEKQRSDLLGAIEGGRTLEKDIEAVKARWTPCLSAIGDVGLEAGESAEEDDKEEHTSDIEDEDDDPFYKRPEDMNIDDLVDSFYS